MDHWRGVFDSYLKWYSLLFLKFTVLNQVTFLDIIFIFIQEVNMNSVERILHYCSTVPQETTSDLCPPPSTWPETGSIVCTCYTTILLSLIINNTINSQ